MKPKFYIVFDKGRRLDFEGYHLSTGSSFALGKSRWFVVDIYKTVGGKYIVVGSGKSNVVHKPNCSQMKEKNILPTDAEKTSVACMACKPSLREPVVHEVNRMWAQVSDEASAIVERLKMRDADGVWYLPKTSSNALLEASKLDEGIYKAFFAPEHIE